MRQQLLKVRRIEGRTFFQAPEGYVFDVSYGDNESFSQALGRGCVQIDQTEYWLAKLNEARKERDREAIKAILDTDDMIGVPEGWVNL